MCVCETKSSIKYSLCKHTSVETIISQILVNNKILYKTNFIKRLEIPEVLIVKKTALETFFEHEPGVLIGFKN